MGRWLFLPSSGPRRSHEGPQVPPTPAQRPRPESDTPEKAQGKESPREAQTQPTPHMVLRRCHKAKESTRLWFGELKRFRELVCHPNIRLGHQGGALLTADRRWRKPTFFTGCPTNWTLTRKPSTEKLRAGGSQALRGGAAQYVHGPPISQGAELGLGRLDPHRTHTCVLLTFGTGHCICAGHTAPRNQVPGAGSLQLGCGV